MQPADPPAAQDGRSEVAAKFGVEEQSSAVRTAGVDLFETRQAGPASE